jgi:hypothetical protein
MNSLEQLAKSEPRPEWKPLGEMGRALKKQEPLLRDLIIRGHENRTIYRAWGFADDAYFNPFLGSMSGLRRFIRKETSR